MDTKTMKQIALGTGLTIVIGTHIAMIFDIIPMSTIMDKNLHSYANLGASGLIIYAVM
jgi:hypothetical protein